MRPLQSNSHIEFRFGNDSTSFPAEQLRAKSGLFGQRLPYLPDYYVIRSKVNPDAYRTFLKLLRDEPFDITPQNVDNLCELATEFEISSFELCRISFHQREETINKLNQECIANKEYLHDVEHLFDQKLQKLELRVSALESLISRQNLPSSAFPPQRLNPSQPIRQ
jgi:hypothetical protein